MKKYTLLITALLLSFSIFSTIAFAKDSLIGYWSNDKVKLNLKADKSYVYKVKIMGITKTFTGKWFADGKTLTLNYTLLGEHKKTANYSFKKGNLLLTQEGKTSILKRKK